MAAWPVSTASVSIGKARLIHPCGGVLRNRIPTQPLQVSPLPSLTVIVTDDGATSVARVYACPARLRKRLKRVEVDHLLNDARVVRHLQ